MAAVFFVIKALPKGDAGILVQPMTYFFGLLPAVRGAGRGRETARAEGPYPEDNKRRKRLKERFVGKRDARIDSFISFFAKRHF
jgi:hypothetical protein